MFEKKKLIIVCATQRKAYGNLLAQLISAKDDCGENVVGCKDGSVIATVWDDKQYADNEPTLSTEQCVLFIGKSKGSKHALAALEDYEVFSRHGTRFYRHGNRAGITVDNRLLSQAEYDEFLEYASLCGKEFKDRVNVKAARGSLLWKLLSTNYLMNKTVQGLLAKKHVTDQQYRLGVIDVYLNELPRFLEG